MTEIASTSVKVGTSPGEGVAEYYVYVRDKEWYTNIIENNGGEAMAIHMIKYATDAGLGRKYEAVASEVWEGLETLQGILLRRGERRFFRGRESSVGTVHD